MGRVMLLDLEATAMGEMVVGTYPNKASTILTSSWALTWDEVSTGLGRSFHLWGGGESMTTGFGLFGVEFPDLWPDMSNITQDRRLLTSMVMLTSLSGFGGVVLKRLDMMTVEHPPRGNAFWSGSFTKGCGMLISRYTDLPPVRLIPWVGTWAGRLWQGLCIHSTLQVGNLQAWGKELADLQLADLSAGGHISLPLRQDT